MNRSARTSISGYCREFVKGEGLRAQLVRGGLGSAGIQAANRILALAFGIVLARALGAEGYGIYAYAFAIMSLLMVAAEAGVPSLLMREVAASQARAEWGLLRGVLRRAGQFVSLTATTVALLGGLVLWWFAETLRPEVVYTTVLMLLVLPLAALSKTLAQAMQGLRRVVVGQAVDMLIRPLLVLVTVAGVFAVWPTLRQPYIAMAAQVLAALVVLLVAALLLRRFMPAESRSAAPAYRSRQWLKSALPFTLIGGAGIINNQADVIMLGWFVPSADVGIYRVAVQGATLVAFSLQVANAVVAPQFSRLYAQGDMVRLQRLVTQSARAILLAALPVTVIFILAGGALVSWIFGAEFAAAHAPLAILAIGQLINAGFGSVGFLLNMTGHESTAARILWQTALLNVVLNLVLIPPFGIIGAAIATGFSLALWNMLLYRQVIKRLNIYSTAIRVGKI